MPEAAPPRSDLNALLDSLDVKRFLASLPPSFVESLELGSFLESDEVWDLLASYLGAVGGQEDAIQAIVDLGVPRDEIHKTREEFRQHHPRVTDEHYGAIGTLLKKYPTTLRDAVVIARVVQRIEELCRELVDCEKARGLLLGEIPDDLMLCLEAALKCIASIVALLVLSWTVAIRRATWASDICLARAVDKLKKSRSELRDGLRTVGGELARLDGDGVSAHHTVAVLAGTAIDSISLAQTATGRAIFESSLPKPSLESDATPDCMAVGVSLLKLPVNEFPQLVDRIQKEASRAAGDRGKHQDKGNLRTEQTQDLITLRDIARLALIGFSTIQNWGTKDRPKPVVQQRGNVPALYSYSLLRAWITKKRPDLEPSLPLDFKKARATLAKMST